MCEPMSLGTVIGIAAGVTSMGATAVSTGFAMSAANKRGKFEQAMGKYQADLDRKRAAEADRSGKFRIEQNALKRRAMVARGKVGAAGRGLLLNTGAPGDAVDAWEQDMAEMGAYEQTMIAQNAATESWTFYANSQAAEAQGSMARQGARYDMWGSALSGAGDFASTGMDVYDFYDRRKA